MFPSETESGGERFRRESGKPVLAANLRERVRGGEVPDLRTHAPQAVETGWREGARQAGLLKQCGLDGGDLGRSGVAVQVTQQEDQAAHERRVGVAAKMAAAGAEFAHHPGGGNAPPDAGVVGPVGGGERRAAPRAVHHGGEALLGVLDEEEVVDHLLLFGGERHGVGTVRRPGAACKRAAVSLHCGMVNPFAISWLWRGFRGNSVTFALLFATFMLGWPLSGQVNHLLAWLGVHWLYALVLPAFFFMWLAKREERLIPEEAKRRVYARGLIVGSLMLALLIALVRR